MHYVVGQSFLLLEAIATDLHLRYFPRVYVTWFFFASVWLRFDIACIYWTGFCNWLVSKQSGYRPNNNNNQFRMFMEIFHWDYKGSFSHFWGFSIAQAVLCKIVKSAWNIFFWYRSINLITVFMKIYFGLCFSCFSGNFRILVRLSA